MLEVPKPIIGAINGACAGYGLVIALMCDIRFAAEGAKFTSAFVRRGLIAEYGVSWLLPRLTGIARALDVLLSGRVFLAEEAREMGLVNRLVAPEAVLADAQAYARDLAENCSPTSMAVIKRQVYGHLDGGLGAALEDSLRLMNQSLTTEDFREGVTSYVEQRQPRFRPLNA
jgi:enoyl-CoA hydratase/carnithine racemase